YDRLQQQVAETIIERPATEDPKFLALMNVLLGMLPAAVFTNKTIHDLAVLRMANLSLEHGPCDASTLAFAQLSMAIGPRFDDYGSGFRYGKMGLALAERADLGRFRGKVDTVVGYHVLPWTEPIHAATSMLRRALDLAQNAADLVFAGFNRVHLISLRVVSGDRLQDVEVEAEEHLQAARRTGFGLVVDCLLGQLSLIRAMRGVREPDDVEIAKLERRLQEDPRLALPANWYWIRKMQTCVLAGDYLAALKVKARADSIPWTGTTFFEWAEYVFYSAIAHAQAVHSSLSAEAAHHRETLAVHHAKLATWAGLCPHTFGSRAVLVAAELARLDARLLDAERCYEEAIRSAHTERAPHVEALASELAAQFYRARGLDRIA